MDFTFATVEEECPNDEDGTATVTVTGGTAPYTYDWNNDGAENPDDDTTTATGLSAGIYVVTVTDANGCTGEGFVVLPDPIDTVSPVISNCPADEVDLVCGTTFPAKLGLSDFTITDNCTAADDHIFLISEAVMSVANCPAGVGNIMRIYTFIDEAGNAAQCNQMISYADDLTAPTLTCSSDITVNLDATGVASISDTDVITSVTDNCTDDDDILTDVSKIAFDKNDIGDNLITITATDECGNQSTCTLNVTIAGSPDMGVAKRAVNIVLQDNGCFLVTYEFNIENLGNTDISNVSLEDDLAAAGYGTCGALSVFSLTSDDFTVNAGYDGSGDIELLSGTNTLACGDKGAVLLTIEACACPVPLDIMNSATVSGQGLMAAQSKMIVHQEVNQIQMAMVKMVQMNQVPQILP